MDSREKIADIIYCEHGTKCKWKCFALDYEGYGHGRIENYLQAWRDWHEKECGGKLIQAVIVKENAQVVPCKYEDWDDTTNPQLCQCNKYEGVDCANVPDDVSSCPDYESQEGE